jgi:hypothetical protein
VGNLLELTSGFIRECDRERASGASAFDVLDDVGRAAGLGEGEDH